MANEHYAAEGTPGADGGYYTQDELRALNDYAQQRGITLVPEIETPAHSEEVLTAYPELCVRTNLINMLILSRQRSNLYFFGKMC